MNTKEFVVHISYEGREPNSGEVMRSIMFQTRHAGLLAMGESRVKIVSVTDELGERSSEGTWVFVLARYAADSFHVICPHCDHTFNVHETWQIINAQTTVPCPWCGMHSLVPEEMRVAK